MRQLVFKLFLLSIFTSFEIKLKDSDPGYLLRLIFRIFGIAARRHLEGPFAALQREGGFKAPASEAFKRELQYSGPIRMFYS